MAKSLENILQLNPRPYLTDAELEVILGGTRNSRYGKVKRLLAKGKLLHIRRGLYCLTDKAGYFQKPHPFELAQFIYALSYISLESALSYHGLIPETVYTITSATGNRSKEFKTPLGLFSYLHVPLKNLYTGVELINESEHKFLMAKPWKAICDYVFCYKKNWTNLKPLLLSLRINVDNLPTLRDEETELLDDYYQHTRLSRFLKGINKELKNRKWK